MQELKARLSVAIRDGKLYEFLREEYHTDKRGEQEISLALAGLQNNNEQDIVKAFRDIKKSEDSMDFSLALDAFGDALPEIEAPLIDAANCVKHLIIEMGRDGSGYELKKSLGEFCNKNPERPDELLKLALQEPQKSLEFLTVALESGSKHDVQYYVNKAVELLDDDSGEIYLQAINALIRIDYGKDSELVLAVVDSIQKFNLAKKSDDATAAAIHALYAICRQHSLVESYFSDFLDVNSDNISDSLIDEAAYILFSPRGELSQEVTEKLVNICYHTKPDNNSTLNKIDLYLENLVKRDSFIEAVTFLEKYFDKVEYKVNFNTFNSFASEIRAHEDSYLRTLITRWLLSCNTYLCGACAKLLSESEKGPVLKFDQVLISNQEASIFLARKACGWFFRKQKTAISLIVSLLEDLDKDGLEEIGSLITNSLLLSYPGTVKEYLEDYKKLASKRTTEFLNGLLESFNKHQEALNKAAKVKELWPSEQDRFSYNKHYSQLMKEAWKNSRKESFFSSLFFGNEQVLLYGNKSIQYIHHNDGMKRHEMPLQEHRHTVEPAILDRLNPHGLQNRLWEYKIEGCDK